ncbi:MAG: hypothetical protein EXR75_01275 [Myxococcales bacterium]|nr:hypothetical protein [Myxococcales bacterium]
MAALQVLEATFAAEGLHVLGFFSNDFGNQGGSGEQIDACSSKYKITFDEFDLGHVIDPDGAGPLVARPVFQWLAAQPNPGPATAPEPKWNFDKYLIGRDGKLVAHWPSATWPGDDPNNAADSFETSPVVIAIKAELAK